MTISCFLVINFAVNAHVADQPHALFFKVLMPTYADEPLLCSYKYWCPPMLMILNPVLLIQYECPPMLMSLSPVLLIQYECPPMLMSLSPVLLIQYECPPMLMSLNPVLLIQYECPPMLMSLSPVLSAIRIDKTGIENVLFASVCFHLWSLAYFSF